MAEQGPDLEKSHNVPFVSIAQLTPEEKELAILDSQRGAPTIAGVTYGNDEKERKEKEERQKANQSRQALIMASNALGAAQARLGGLLTDFGRMNRSSDSFSALDTLLENCGASYVMQDFDVGGGKIIGVKRMLHREQSKGEKHGKLYYTELGKPGEKIYIDDENLHLVRRSASHPKDHLEFLAVEDIPSRRQAIETAERKYDKQAPDFIQKYREITAAEQEVASKQKAVGELTQGQQEENDPNFSVTVNAEITGPTSPSAQPTAAAPLIKQAATVKPTPRSPGFPRL